MKRPLISEPVQLASAAGHTPRCTPCFTPGTLITTHRGEMPVEAITAGDRVVTRDNGIQTVRWVGRTQMFLHDFQAEPHLLPVFIQQGSLGKGLPERDMMVSPNHRVLVTNSRATVRYSDREVLVAAKHLAAQGIHTVQSSGTTYIHFMCDRHEVVLSNGVWTETFHPDDSSLKGIGNAQRLEILELFPELKTEAGRSSYGPARMVMEEPEAAGYAFETAGDLQPAAV
jgi:Hint domain